MKFPIYTKKLTNNTKNDNIYTIPVSTLANDIFNPKKLIAHVPPIPLYRFAIIFVKLKYVFIEGGFILTDDEIKDEVRYIIIDYIYLMKKKIKKEVKNENKNIYSE